MACLLWAATGCCPRKKNEPQEFVIDLELFLNLDPAGREDRLELTVDYSQVYDTVKKIAEKKSFNLIEALADNIANEILDTFPVQSVRVTVYKPHAPVEGKFDYFAVTIQRERGNE